MKNIRNESGITLVALAVTIVVLMILSVSLTASMTTTIEMTRYNKIKEDIIALTEDVKVYYTKNGTLPAYTDTPINLDTHNVPANDRNPNDSGVYYPIDISLLPEDLMLNCGQGNKDKDFSTDDLYVMDSESLTVYYLKGALLNNVRHYTIVDDFSGGSLASEYYSKVDLPIISVVTMVSNGEDETKAKVGDTVTLKMLSNYQMSQTPTITINGENVTSSCVWNGKIGTAEYTVSSIANSEGMNLAGTPIEFSIADYVAEGRTGETITNVTFGKQTCFEETYYYLVDETIYTTTLAKAVAKAGNGSTIKALRDATETETLTIDKNLNIDTNGKTITYKGSQGKILINENTNVSIQGKGTLINEEVGSSFVINDGTLQLKGITIKSNAGGGTLSATLNNEGEGGVTIDNCTINSILNNSNTIYLNGGDYGSVGSVCGSSYNINDANISSVRLTERRNNCDKWWNNR